MKKRFTKKSYQPVSLLKSPRLKNANKLVIVESPSKCPKIEGFLGTEYMCIASIGHIRYIKGLKSIDIKNNYDIEFDLCNDKVEHVKEMKELVTMFRSDNIFIGTDDDREGEAIAWHLCEVLGLSISETKRILFHEVTKPALVNAVSSPTTINMKLVNAQKARQVLDVLVGFKVSPYLWKYLYNNKENSLSAGRCQTPALRLIYDNNETIKQEGNSSIQYKASGIFFDKHITFHLNHVFESNDLFLSFLNKSKTHSHTIVFSKETQHTRSPPSPFSTSRLLQTANQLLHMSPKETMDHCQQLYQSGFITYMRTESTKYSNSFLEKMKQFITSNYNTQCLPNDLSGLVHKSSVHPHEAIRVTDITINKIESKNNRMLSVYSLIRKNTIESCMSEYKYTSTKININAPQEYIYEYSIETPIRLGWKSYSEHTPITQLQQEAKSLLFYFQSYSNKEIDYIRIEGTPYQKKGTSYYSEASLINTLEKMGIGRPSTFASIVQTIQERNYVERKDIPGMIVEVIHYSLEKGIVNKEIMEKEFGAEKNKLMITNTGLLVLPFLLEHFNSLFEYDYTKDMETKLDDISNGSQIEWFELCDQCNKQIKELSGPIKKVDKKCYPIKENYDLVFEKYGPSIRHHINEKDIEYFPVKKELNLTIADMESQKYTLEELKEEKDKVFGMWNNQEVTIQDGRYGRYIKYGEVKKSIKQITKPTSEISWEEDILPLLQGKVLETNVLRKYNDTTSLRKGKYGPYIFYQTASMKKPEFVNIKKYKGDCFHDPETTILEWVQQSISSK